MDAENRTGDKVFIEGDYQERALNQGIIFQRTWHRLKLQAAAQSLHGTGKEEILDIGCGSGTLLQFIKPGYQNYTGLDINEAAIEYCTARYPAHQNHFKRLEFDNLSLLKGSLFTHIFFLESIEHVTVAQGMQILTASADLLAPNGTMVITTPNRRSAWPLIEKLLDLFKLTPPLDKEQHEHLYSPAELKKLAKEAGFEVQRLFTINAIAPWLSFLGTKITNAIHRWECKNNFIPGSIMVMELSKPASR